MRKTFSFVATAASAMLHGKVTVVSHLNNTSVSYQATLYIYTRDALREEISIKLSFKSIHDIQIWLQGAGAVVVRFMLCNLELRGDGVPLSVQGSDVTSICNELSSHLDNIEEKAHEWQGSDANPH